MRLLTESWDVQSVALNFLLDLRDVRVVLAVSYLHDSNGLGQSTDVGQMNPASDITATGPTVLPTAPSPACCLSVLQSTVGKPPLPSSFSPCQDTQERQRRAHVTTCSEPTVLGVLDAMMPSSGDHTRYSSLVSLRKQV